jgi:hypothetical protein
MMTALAVQQDPFQDLDKAKEAPKPRAPEDGAGKGFFEDNFTFKKEIFSQFSYSTAEPLNGESAWDNTYSRQSLGCEILKKFSTPTSTVASFDVQARLVWRDRFIEVIDDMEGEHREGWTMEVHNLYADFYNVFSPLLSPEGESENLGRFNLRVGHFYLPMGLNLQTDTHGTVIQLSNDRNFGFDRDWYAGFWGSITRELSYDAYYLAGSGYDPDFRGQTGMVGLRLSLSGEVRNQVGLEGGISLLSGERLSKDAINRSPSVAADSRGKDIVDTFRVGIDARYTFSVPTGSIILTTELTTGRDEADGILTQLYEVDYLSERRNWGATVQYRRFAQDIGLKSLAPAGTTLSNVEASLVVELAWYFQNDLSGAYLHSIRFNVENQLKRQSGEKGTVFTVQYYYYW